MHWASDGWTWGGWIVMFLMMSAFWVLAITLVVWLVRGTRSPGRGERGEPRSGAMAVLEERYARGEIDRDEFEERRATLLRQKPS